MNKEKSDITTIVVADKEYSAIILGPEENGVPKHLLQLERKEGMIIDGTEITSFNWKGVTKDDKLQYIYFDKMDIEPIYLIATKYRDKAKDFIMAIAHGLIKANNDFLNLESGVFPLYRIYIKDGSQIVLLPPDMGDMIAIARMGERRAKDINYLIKKDTELSFRLIMEMAELLYYAAAGMLPYEKENVRICGYREVPVEWYEKKLNPEIAKLISMILHTTERKQRDIGGNRKPQQNLGWFIQNILPIDWNLEAITSEESERKIKEAESTKEYQSFFERMGKEAKTRNFWRVKGTMIVTAALIIAIVGGILGNIIWLNAKPPVTKDMSQTEFIEHFYQAQSELDASNLEAGFKTTVPQSTEVTSLFVTKQSRLAYEGFDAIMNVNDWLEAGKPDVRDQSVIYGVVLHDIEQLDEDTYRAHTTWYTPYSYEKGEAGEEDYVAPEGYSAVFMYDICQDFTFEWNKRGWWQVVELTNPVYEYVGMELVPTYKVPSMAEQLQMAVEQTANEEI